MLFNMADSAPEDGTKLVTPAQKRLYDAALRLFVERGACQVSVSELAEAAGVSRGTIYNNLKSTTDLFRELAAQLTTEMTLRVVKSYADQDGPVERLSMGIRFYVRRAHEEPLWGRFITQFSLSNDTLFEVFRGAPVQDVLAGVDAKRYSFRPEQLLSVVSMISAVVLGAMFLVLEGHKTWRDAGSDAAELVLRALGVDAESAQQIAALPLPSLLPLD